MDSIERDDACAPRAAERDPLWSRLSAYSLDDPDAALPFSRRLARENGWSPGFAARVIDEYKRFCYLAMRAGHPVTSSDQVDQAWHLHLLYTRDYWGEFRTDILGGPLHHGPTRGGAGEDAKFRDWYQATLDSYGRLFGAAPPADIWPSAERRFRHAAAFRRLNMASVWVLSRPRPVDMATLAALAAILVMYHVVS